MSEYLGRKGQGYIQQIGFCQRCGWKYLRTELIEDDYIKGLLVCCYCHDPDHPQRYPAAPRAEGQPPLTPAPDQYPGPLAPTLTGSYDNVDTVYLSWTRAFDDADLINQYLIYRNTNGGSFSLIASVPYIDSYDFPNNQVEPFESGLNYSDDTVAPGTNYQYYVVADAVDKRLSPNSNVFSIFTQPPPAILSGSYNFTSNAADLSWVMPGSWGPSVLNYVIYRSVNGGAFSMLATVGGSTLSYVDSTANNFLNLYQYYVVAEFAGANSLPSDTVTEPVVVTTVYMASATFTKPAGLGQVFVSAIGAGGGGYGGRINGTGAGGGWGGPGGGGGAFASASFAASALGSTVAITVGAGGVGGVLSTGGIAITGPIAGASGGNSSFGSLLVAGGGSGTASLTHSVCPGGTASHSGGSNVTLENGANGGGQYENITANIDQPGVNSTLAAAGGGSGNSNTNDTGPSRAPNSPATGVGGNSSVAAGGTAGAGLAGPNSAGAVVAISAGGVGAPSSSNAIGGGGGGGGGFASINPSFGPSSATGLHGGSGGFPGGGGGGGGGAQGGGSGRLDQTETSGAGGNGANGIVVVTTYS